MFKNRCCTTDSLFFPCLGDFLPQSKVREEGKRTLCCILPLQTLNKPRHLEKAFKREPLEVTRCWQHQLRCVKELQNHPAHRKTTPRHRANFSLDFFLVERIKCLPTAHLSTSPTVENAENVRRFFGRSESFSLQSVTGTGWKLSLGCQKSQQLAKQLLSQWSKTLSHSR